MRITKLTTLIGALVGLSLCLACGSSSPAGTEMDAASGVPYRVADVAPGTASAFGTGAALAAADGRVFFRARDGEGALKLWSSDGTATGTVALARADLGSAQPAPSSFAWVRPLLFFDADDGQHGRELWRSDGTAQGTRLLKDVVPGPEADTLSRFSDVGGTLFFVAGRSSRFRSVAYRLFKSDGTSDGTVMVKELGSASTGGSGSPVLGQPLVVGSTLFLAWGRQLWRSDGSEAGTAPLFGDLSLEGTVSLAAWRGRLAFLAGGYGPNGLWTSDGTVAGTRLVRDLGLDAEAGSLHATASGRLFFITEDELWTSDGTAEGTVPVFTFADSRPSPVAVVGEAFLFYRKGSLWRTDGTAAGTVLVAEMLGPRTVIAAGRWLYFGAGDGVHGEELWRSDGSPAGTELVADMWPGPETSRPADFVLAGSRLFFTADDGRAGRELWALSVGAGR